MKPQVTKKKRIKRKKEQKIKWKRNFRNWKGKKEKLLIMSRYNQSSGGPSSHTQTYRAIVVGGGGVGKSAITIQFIQVSSGMHKNLLIANFNWEINWVNDDEVKCSLRIATNDKRHGSNCVLMIKNRVWSSFNKQNHHRSIKIQRRAQNSRSVSYVESRHQKQRHMNEVFPYWEVVCWIKRKRKKKYESEE